MFTSAAVFSWMERRCWESARTKLLPHMSEFRYLMSGDKNGRCEERSTRSARLSVTVPSRWFLGSSPAGGVSRHGLLFRDYISQLAQVCLAIHQESIKTLGGVREFGLCSLQPAGSWTGSRLSNGWTESPEAYTDTVPNSTPKIPKCPLNSGFWSFEAQISSKLKCELW